MSNQSSRVYRLLVVDDEPDVLYAFQKGLEDNGFEVDAFTDPLEALSHFKNTIAEGAEYSNSNSYRYYDLVLLDLKMEKMNGFELFLEMEKAARNSQIRVCFMTAFEGLYNTLKKDFPALDGRCFIRKPIQLQNLVMEVNAELGK
jgi:DNA-binding response OmpR family regulator